MYENAIEVLKILEKNKYKAYIVGGFPRDLYLKRKSSDVDICTNARPKDLTKIFADTKITNIDYGCVIVKHKGTTFAITTFRSDNKYKNFRTPESINYVDNLLEDLNRRDFIINTMCIDLKGNTIDLLDAKKDLDNAGKAKSWFGAFMGIFISNKIMLQAILSAGIMALTFVSVTMILLIAAELKLLQQEAMKLDRDRVLGAVDKVLGTAKFISDCIFKGKYYDDNIGEIRTDYDHDQKTWLGKMFTGIGTILNTICSSAIMMMSFISISMIWLMAKELTSLQNIELNKDAIASNIEKIITTAKQVIDVVNAPSDTKEKNKDDGIIGKLLNFVLPSNMKYMIDAISTMGFTAVTMIAIGIIRKIGKQLTKIQELPALDKVQSNTKVLMETCKAVISIVENQNFNVKKLAKHIKAVKRIKNLVKNIAGLINIEVKEDKLSSSIGTLVTSANNIITSIGDININNINIDRIDKIAEMFRGIKKLANVANRVTALTIDELGYTSFIQSVNNIMKELHPKRVSAVKRKQFDNHINIFKDLNESIKHTNETVSSTDISNIVDNESLYIKLVNLINNVAKELHPKRVSAVKRNKFDAQLTVFGLLTSFVNENYEDIANVSSKTFVSYDKSGYGQFIGLLGNSCKDIIKLVQTFKC